MNKLIEVNGRFYQECNIIMVATKNKSWLTDLVVGLNYCGDTTANCSFDKIPYYLFLKRNDDRGKIQQIHQQHLCITSDEEIKEGDYYTDGKFVELCNSCPEQANMYLVKKIIATTDKSLRFKNDIPEFLLGNEYLPQPSQQFIEAYTEAYNSDKPITKVMVEYEENFQYLHHDDDNLNVWIRVKDIAEKVSIDAYRLSIKEHLKVDKDNTINIKPIKDSWNLNEIKIFAVKCFNAGRQYQIDSIDIFNDKWIEENSQINL